MSPAVLICCWFSQRIDLGDVCMPLYCPLDDLMESLSQFPDWDKASKKSLLSTFSCSGVVPDYNGIKNIAGTGVCYDYAPS